MNQFTKIVTSCAAALLTMGIIQVTHATETANRAIAPSPIGLWKTIDDTTGKPKAIIQISETADKTLVGKILKIFPAPGHDQNERCTACEGDRHNQKIVGMVFLEKLKRESDNKRIWSGGEILDPKNGKVYHCNVNLSDNSQRLNVRGYIGLPLFGRTQTWLRVANIEKA